jgi:crotonobetainyl-CoA:carnitine CoA-transferase CaiB-like acyl-CoA transferase
MGKPEELADPLWRNFMFRNECRAVVEDLISSFTMSHSKAELYEEGQNRRVMMGPVNTITDFVKNPQINDRKYFVGLEHSYMGKQTHPGAPYKLSETPWKLERPAPRIGEHNKEIYEELGYSEDEVAQLKESSII